MSLSGDIGGQKIWPLGSSQLLIAIVGDWPVAAVGPPFTVLSHATSTLFPLPMHRLHCSHVPAPSLLHFGGPVRKSDQIRLSRYWIYLSPLQGCPGNCRFPLVGKSESTTNLSSKFSARYSTGRCARPSHHLAFGDPLPFFDSVTPRRPAIRWDTLPRCHQGWDPFYPGTVR